MTDSSNLNRLLLRIAPNEVYNLAAQSHVAVSFEVPEYTADSSALGVTRLLEAIRGAHIPCRVYQASTSELFGGFSDTVPQNELTPFHPRSPYSVAKLYAYWICNNFRESYGMYICNGILFNHESPRRGENFVTKKIAVGAARIKHGLQDTLYLGNLNASRDWGYAPDFVESMWLMLQQEQPDDYVIATEQTNTVEDFASTAFSIAGLALNWEGEGIDRKGYDTHGNVRIAVDPSYFRPSEVDILRGDASKAMRTLNWKPKTSFEDLVEIMVRYELDQHIERRKVRV